MFTMSKPVLVFLGARGLIPIGAVQMDEDQAPASVAATAPQGGPADHAADQSADAMVDAPMGAARRSRSQSRRKRRRDSEQRNQELPQVS